MVVLFYKYMTPSGSNILFVVRKFAFERLLAQTAIQIFQLLQALLVLGFEGFCFFYDVGKLGLEGDGRNWYF